VLDPESSIGLTSHTSDSSEEALILDPGGLVGNLHLFNGLSELISAEV